MNAITLPGIYLFSRQTDLRSEPNSQTTIILDFKHANV